MDGEKRIKLGTISIWLSMVPFLAFVSWFVFHQPCNSPIRAIQESVVMYGTLVALPFSIFAVVKDKPKKRAIIGLLLSSFIVLCFAALIGAIVYAIATGGGGPGSAVELTYADNALYAEPGHFQTTETTYYDISGATRRELEDQMARLGPKGFSAFTDASYRWKYEYVKSGDSCAIGRVRVDTKIVYTYPCWDATGASDDLREQWKEALASMEAHEKVRGEIALKGGVDIFGAIQQVSAAATCEELGKIANARGQELSDEAQKQQEEYDRATDHGRNTPQ